MSAVRVPTPNRLQRAIFGGDTSGHAQPCNDAICSYLVPTRVPTYGLRDEELSARNGGELSRAGTLIDGSQLRHPNRGQFDGPSDPSPNTEAHLPSGPRRQRASSLFDGGLEARIVSWQKGMLPTHGQTEEVPR